MIAAHAWFYFAWIIPAAIGLLLARLARRRGMEILIAGGGWFLAALAPVLGFSTFAFQHFSTAADRYLYLPMFGIALMGAWGLSRVRKKHHAAAAVFTFIILALLGTRTLFQLGYWRDTPTLFKHCIDVTGQEPGVREN